MGDVYHLYLDESETHDNGNNVVFSIGGIIIEENEHNGKLTDDLKLLKSTFWSDLPNYENLILHEKEIRFAFNTYNKYNLKDINSEFRRFKNPNNTKKLYSGLEKIIRTNNIYTIGACVVMDEVNKNYHTDILTNKSFMAMQIIMENYCHFLKTHNSVGKIFYESINANATDKEMRLRVHQIQAMGTMYVNPYILQELILGINFPNKKDNIAGLQIADFIPNDLARCVSKKKKHVFNLSKDIKRRLYDGKIGNKSRFGLKIIPSF